MSNRSFLPTHMVRHVPVIFWYLPHHQVVNSNEPDKVRRVAKAASKFQGVSLNSYLEAGLDLFNKMSGLLLRLREQTIAVSADFEGIFKQIVIKEPDQNALSFLWTSQKNLNQYQYKGLIFDAKCSPKISF